MSPVAIIFIGLVHAQLAGASTYLKAKRSRSPRWSPRMGLLRVLRESLQLSSQVPFISR